MVLESKGERENAADARLHLRRKAVEFDEADADDDHEIDYDEFKNFIVPQAAGAHSEEELREWWSLMDIDGDQLIRKDEFFLYALCAASKKCGSGIAAIFKKFDSDGSGSLDELEFTRALEDMGFGDCATDVYEEHCSPDGTTISYLRM